MCGLEKINRSIQQIKREFLINIGEQKIDFNKNWLVSTDDDCPVVEIKVLKQGVDYLGDIVTLDADNNIIIKTNQAVFNNKFEI